MKLHQMLILVASLLLIGAAAAQESPSWEGMAKHHKTENWKNVKRVQFTWKHNPSGLARTYDWDVKSNRVVTTLAGKQVEFAADGRGLEGDDQIASHKAFINDRYWLLFEFHVFWDSGIRLVELGELDSPLGNAARAFRVEYPAAKGGYTPGDHYTLLLGKGHEVMGWGYHPGGSKKAKMWTTREGWTPAGPLVLPTAFKDPAGETVIEIVGLQVH